MRLEMNFEGKAKAYLASVWASRSTRDSTTGGRLWYSRTRLGWGGGVGGGGGDWGIHWGGEAGGGVVKGGHGFGVEHDDRGS
jgi:hypothetical protein